MFSPDEGSVEPGFLVWSLSGFVCSLVLVGCTGTSNDNQSYLISVVVFYKIFAT